MELLVAEMQRTLSATQCGMHTLLKLIRDKKRMAKTRSHLTSEEKDIVYTLWKKIYRISNEFCKLPMRLSQPDILHLFERQETAPSKNFCVIPKVPSQPISIENALLVDIPSFKFMVSAWREKPGDEPAYFKALEDIQRLKN